MTHQREIDATSTFLERLRRERALVAFCVAPATVEAAILGAVGDRDVLGRRGQQLAGQVGDGKIGRLGSLRGALAGHIDCGGRLNG